MCKSDKNPYFSQGFIKVFTLEKSAKDLISTAEGNFPARIRLQISIKENGILDSIDLIKDKMREIVDSGCIIFGQCLIRTHVRLSDAIYLGDSDIPLQWFEFDMQFDSSFLFSEQIKWNILVSLITILTVKLQEIGYPDAKERGSEYRESWETAKRGVELLHASVRGRENNLPNMFIDTIHYFTDTEKDEKMGV